MLVIPVEATVALLEAVFWTVADEAPVTEEPDVAICSVEMEEDTLTVFADWVVATVSDIVDDVASVVRAVAVLDVAEVVHTLESRLICNKRKNRKPVGKTDKGQQMSVTTRAFTVFACG